MIIFFHIFRCRRDQATRRRGRGLIYLEPTFHDFGPLPKPQSFEDQFFLVTPVIFEAHYTVCDIDDIVDGRCVCLFSKYFIEYHFLLGNHLYVYKREDLSNEARYQKARLVKFISNLRYIRGGTSVEEVDKKRLQHFLDVW